MNLRSSSQTSTTEGEGTEGHVYTEERSFVCVWNHSGATLSSVVRVRTDEGRPTLQCCAGTFPSSRVPPEKDTQRSCEEGGRGGGLLRYETMKSYRLIEDPSNYNFIRTKTDTTFCYRFLLHWTRPQRDRGHFYLVTRVDQALESKENLV